MSVVAGVDVGGTWTEAVALVDGGAVIGRARLATDTRDATAILDGAAAAVSQAVDGRPGDGLSCVGIGIPGQVDPGTGTVRLAMNLRIDDDGLPVGPMLRERLGVPTIVENDVRAAAVGAYDHLRATSEPDLCSLAYLSIGTGISAGAVLDGRLHRGWQGMAGEIGHVVVVADGAPCRCGLRGCLEAEAAGPAIQRMWPTEDGRPAEAMFRAAAAGDRGAKDRTEEVIGRYVLAIQWLATTWGADLVALGGGIGSIGGPLLDPLRERLAGWASRSDLAGRLLPPERVVAMPPDLPTGALGAAALARRWSPARDEERQGERTGERTDVDSAEPSGRGE
ncbi:MAG: ROK family protein [Actinomycetota bacterium]